MTWLDPFLEERLGKLKHDNLLRRLRCIEKVDGPWVTIEGRRLLCFCSNDYLGLAQKTQTVSVGGTGGSRLLCGTFPEHVELERRMAKFKGAEAALLFNSAYLANLGLITSLADASTTVYSDELNHASLIDAIRLSKAKVVIYPHRDTAALRRLLTPGRNLVVTESLFSMDGDLAPIAELSELDAELVVDDTHATGILGERGRGTAADVQVCNLAKAGGFMGGFVVGSQRLIDLLTTTARTMVYTTSLPAGICRAAIHSIDALESADAARAKLRRNIEHLAATLSVSSFTPIFPFVVGSTERALKASEELWNQGFFVPAIRPPTVPEGAARLRITLTAMHETDHIDALAKALCRI